MKTNASHPASAATVTSFATVIAAASLTLASALAQPPPRPPSAPAAPPAAPQPAAPHADPAVIDVERALTQRGFYRGPLDGVLTPETVNAIRAFQQANRLEPTGQITPPLMHALGIGGPARKP